jgi:hypothetical protein
VLCKRVALFAAALVFTLPAFADTSANASHKSSHKAVSESSASKGSGGKTSAVQGVIYSTQSPRNSAAGVTPGIRPHAPATPSSKPPGKGNPAILHTFNGTLPIPK